MSKLEAYFLKHPHRQRIELARWAGISSSRVTQLCQGQTPSLWLALKIEQWTRGEVRPRDWGSFKPKGER